MRALVTGDIGFAGHHLVKSLLADGYDVCGLDIRAHESADVSDEQAVFKAVRACQPEVVFHLAGIARPGLVKAKPEYGCHINIQGALNVLEAVRRENRDVKVLLVGSSDEYGPDVDLDGIPRPVVDERSVCLPESPYGASKLAATALGLAYTAAYGMHVAIARPWMHTGPGAPDTAAVSNLAKKLVACERGADTYPHGDLETLVDLTDVRDVVRAYRILVDCEPGIYNICRGERISLQSLLVMMLADSPLAGVGLPMHRDPAFGKGTDMPQAYASKLRVRTNWLPAIPLRQTLADLADYWRAQ